MTLYVSFLFQRRRATAHESLKHSWICFHDDPTLPIEEPPETSDEEIIEEEIVGLTNEIDAQNFN